MRRLTGIAIAVAALTWAASPAHAAHVSCGQTVTADTTLDSDLECPEHGLVVGASGVTIDLGGHTVRGDGSGPTTGGDEDAGVLNIGFADLEVTNGELTEFEAGVTLREAHRGRLHDLTIVGNNFGIEANGSAENLIDHNVLRENRRPAISVRFGSFQNTIEHNSVSGLGVSSVPLWGIFVFGAHDNRVAENSVSGFGSGIALEGDSASNVVERNVSSQNGEGVTIGLRETDSRIIRNTIHDNEIGIRVEESDRNRIEENEIRDNELAGITLDRFGFGGISRDNVIAANDVSGSDTGILLFKSERNQLAGNTLFENTGDGILVNEASSGNTIRENAARANGDDGIDVDRAPNTITGNSAFANADWGIEAVAGVTDGGGNRGWSNGQPAQCLNVVCGPGPPARLDLSPAEATNPVGESHCVEAAVSDPDGRATPGVIVRFSVEDTNTSGAKTSDAGGRAGFCYDGPVAPREDRIAAYADSDDDAVQDEGEPAAGASKTWLVPGSSGTCKVKGGGSIQAANGDIADFRLALQVRKSRVARGSLFFEDLGPAEPLVVRSNRTASIACGGASAAVFGRTHGSSPLYFRIDVVDGDTDRFRIRVSSGYDSGDQSVVSGDIRIR